MTPGIYVGVSGFSYPSWKGTFYEKDTKAEEFLTFYAQRLGSVEINSSFYAPPRDTMIESWRGKTKRDFVFAFKAPQLVTHILKLGKGSVEAARGFSERLAPLESRRGPILFQLPPYMKQDLELLESFLAGTKDIDDRVFEFRHKSWLQESTYALLEEHGANFCVSDTEDMEPVFRVTGRFAYFRLRRDAYAPGSMEDWANKIRETIRGKSLKKGAVCYVYLRHDETGANAVLAQELARRLKGDE